MLWNALSRNTQSEFCLLPFFLFSLSLAYLLTSLLSVSLSSLSRSSHFCLLTSLLFASSLLLSLFSSLCFFSANFSFLLLCSLLPLFYSSLSSLLFFLLFVPLFCILPPSPRLFSPFFIISSRFAENCCRIRECSCNGRRSLSPASSNCAEFYSHIYSYKKLPLRIFQALDAAGHILPLDLTKFVKQRVDLSTTSTKEVRWLLAKGLRFDEELLSVAAQSDRVDLLRLALESGATFPSSIFENAVKVNRWMVLVWAARNNIMFDYPVREKKIIWELFPF